MDSLSALWNHDEHNAIPEEDVIGITLFEFDPNRIPEDDLLALGFSKGLTKRLINYRNKGGKFKVRSDLMKLYGMDSAFYDTLHDFILLPDQITQAHANVIIPKQEANKKEALQFNLNQADTTQLKRIYGIGSKLSHRIVSYRDKLGGFVTSQQLHEVYGLDSLVIEKLIAVSFIQEGYYPRTVNLNSAKEEELAAHPYISKRMARTIVTYRFQHGKFQVVDDLRTRLQLDEINFTKIRPYVTVD